MFPLRRTSNLTLESYTNELRSIDESVPGDLLHGPKSFPISSDFRIHVYPGLKARIEHEGWGLLVQGE